MLYAEGGPHSTLDEAFGAFQNSPHADIDSSPLLAIPPEGTCTAYTGSYQSGVPSFHSFPDALLGMLEGRGMKAGKALGIAGSQGGHPIPPTGTGSYWVRLGLEEPGIRSNRPLFFVDPAYSLSGMGGDEVGAFTRRIAAPAAFEWTDEHQRTLV